MKWLKSLIGNRKEKAALLAMAWDLTTAIQLIQDDPKTKVMMMTFPKQKFYNSLENRMVARKRVVGHIRGGQSLVYKWVIDLGFSSEQVIKQWVEWRSYAD